MNYVDQLKVELNKRLTTLTQMARGENQGNNKEVENKFIGPEITALLSAALKNEYETALISSQWASDERDWKFRMTLARLAGDEAKHFEMILTELSARSKSVDPEVLNQYTPFFNYLLEQKTTFDRVVTGPFTREAIACARNALFVEYCKKRSEKKVLEIYAVVEADESHHQKIGEKLLLELIKTETDYQHALKKMREVLDLVEDIQEIAVLKKGLCFLPGC